MFTFLSLRYFLLAFGCLSVSCKAVLFTTTGRISAVKITLVYPAGGYWQAERYDTMTAELYFYKNQVACSFPKNHLRIVDEKPAPTAAPQQLVVFSKGKATGLRFDLMQPGKATPVNIDSLFENEWIFKTNLYAFFSDSNNITEISTSYSNDSSVLLKQFYISRKSDTSASCQLSLHFSNRPLIKGYSLSWQLDYLYNRKLTAATISSFPKYYACFNQTQDVFTISYQLEEIPLKNPGTLLYFFKQNELTE